MAAIIDLYDGSIAIFSEYDAQFVKDIKSLNNRHWDGDNKCWVTSNDNLNRVKSLLNLHFGDYQIIDDFERALKFWGNTIKVDYIDGQGELRVWGLEREAEKFLKANYVNLNLDGSYGNYTASVANFQFVLFSVKYFILTEKAIAVLNASVEIAMVAAE